MYLLTLVHIGDIYLLSVRSTGKDPDPQDWIGKCVHVVRRSCRHDPVWHTATTNRYSRSLHHVFGTADNMFYVRSDFHQGAEHQDRPGSHSRTVPKDKPIRQKLCQRLF